MSQAREGAVLGAVAVGGVAGALARYAAARLWPTAPGDFPWTTLAVNAGGCAAIGVLLVLVVEHRRGHPLLRPLLGSGFLGGFTTFSAYSLDLQRDLADGRTGQALLYGALTLLAALGAVVLGATGARRWAR